MLYYFKPPYFPFLSSDLDLVNIANVVQAQMSVSPRSVPRERQPY